MIHIKTVFLDILIKNNDEEINYKKITALINKEIISFKIGDDSYNLIINDIIKFNKENNESILDLKFSMNMVTDGIYYIKELNYNMDVRIKTKELIIEDNRIYIEYNMILQEEDLGNYLFRIDIKE